MGETQATLFPDPPVVSLAMSFEDLLGKRAASMPANERRARWATWLRLACLAGEREIASEWLNNAECVGCIHRRGHWCAAVNLPCAVNPLLSYRLGCTGMACAGAGFTPPETPAPDSKQEKNRD